MRMYDIIVKKRDGKQLSKEEIDFMIDGYVKKQIPDYQMSAFLMAVYFNGMTDTELLHLTKAMTNSGDIVDLSSISGIKADKHSTGGVGDKTTLIIAPIVATCGIKMAKMSGRGLGHTGGTVDKLESIPNIKTNFSSREFLDIVKSTNMIMAGQSGNLVPADKMLYALRDVTATVESIPLIAASIMSKKLASGSDVILLDVKVGSGAFMKDIGSAKMLAEKMVAIGKNAGKKTIAVLTNMDIPLGNAIGNALEVNEAIDVLQNEGEKDLTNLCIVLSQKILELSGYQGDAHQKVIEVLQNGQAYQKFLQVVNAQGGNLNNKLDINAKSKDIVALKDGYIEKIDTMQCGMASLILGAGRKVKEDNIDYNSGIVLSKKTGDKVCKGDILCTMYSNDILAFSEAQDILNNAYTISCQKTNTKEMVLGIVE
ncbi:MAG: thymidine phosphorylase [Oscillospiraceae bacterium]